MMNDDDDVQMFARMVRPNGYERNVILRDCNVACLQFFPGFRVIGPQIVHVCDVSWPESLVFDPVKCEDLLLANEGEGQRYGLLRQRTGIASTRCR